MKKLNTEVDSVTNSTAPHIKLVPKTLSLHLDFGRQDLNENFLKIQEAINELNQC